MASTGRGGRRGRPGGVGASSGAGPRSSPTSWWAARERRRTAEGLPRASVERIAERCGRRLSRAFPQYEIVTLPLPEEVMCAMTPTERRLTRTAYTDFWPAFFDGWDAQRAGD
jgi:hypothetical protein